MPKLLRDMEMAGAQSSVLPTSDETPLAASVHAALAVYPLRVDVSECTRLLMPMSSRLPAQLELRLPNVQAVPNLRLPSTLVPAQGDVQPSYASLCPRMSTSTMPDGAYDPSFEAEEIGPIGLDVQEKLAQACHLIHFPISALKAELKNFGCSDVGIIDKDDLVLILSGRIKTYTDALIDMTDVCHADLKTFLYEKYDAATNGMNKNQMLCELQERRALVLKSMPLAKNTTFTARMMDAINKTSSSCKLLRGGVPGSMYTPSMPVHKRKQAPVAAWTSTKFASGMCSLQYYLRACACVCACAHILFLSLFLSLCNKILHACASTCVCVCVRAFSLSFSLSLCSISCMHVLACVCVYVCVCTYSLSLSLPLSLQ